MEDSFKKASRMIIDLQNKNAELQLDNSALKSMLQKREKIAFENVVPSKKEIEDESNYRMIEGACKHSFLCGANWAIRKIFEKCSANQ